MNSAPIPQEWIRKYIDSLLDFAKRAGPDSAMGKAAMLRADHVMDLVEAFRVSTPKETA